MEAEKCSDVLFKVEQATRFLLKVLVTLRSCSGKGCSESAEVSLLVQG